MSMNYQWLQRILLHHIEQLWSHTKAYWGIKSEEIEILYSDLVINKYNIWHIVFILEKNKIKIRLLKNIADFAVFNPNFCFQWLILDLIMIF